MIMATDFRIRPLADRVVVKPAAPEEQTKGGIYLPDTASKERPMEYAVELNRLIQLEMEGSVG
jgi:chaperonin GroES